MATRRTRGPGHVARQGWIEPHRDRACCVIRIRCALGLIDRQECRIRVVGLDLFGEPVHVYLRAMQPLGQGSSGEMFRGSPYLRAADRCGQRA